MARGVNVKFPSKALLYVRDFLPGTTLAVVKTFSGIQPWNDSAVSKEI